MRILAVVEAPRHFVKVGREMAGGPDQRNQFETTRVPRPSSAWAGPRIPKYLAIPHPDSAFFITNVQCAPSQKSNQNLRDNAP